MNGKPEKPKVEQLIVSLSRHSQRRMDGNSVRCPRIASSGGFEYPMWERWDDKAGSPTLPPKIRANQVKRGRDPF
jgi:hypothetical protein